MPSCLRLGFALVLALIGLSQIGQAAGADIALQPVSSSAAPKASPETDGQTVVWVEYQDDQLNDGDIHGVSVVDGNEFVIADGPVDQSFPDIAGDIAVWAEEDLDTECQACPRDIRAKDLTTGDEFQIANTNADDTYPVVDGHRVVWIQNDNGFLSLQARDLDLSGPPTTLAPVAGTPVGRPSLDGDRVIWGEFLAADNGGHWQLLSLEIGSDNRAIIAEGEGHQLFGYDISGNTVTYVAGGQLMVLDLSTQQSEIIASSARNPTTNGRYVFWEDLQHFSDTDGHRVDIDGYDREFGCRFVVANEIGRAFLPVADGDVLTWAVDTGQSQDVYATPIADVLPTARRSPSGTEGDDFAFYTETGHYLGFGFKAFWEQNGGLPVFGYPLTEEFSELNFDDQQLYTVQYVERQRFEWHPEFVGTVYEVLLGRLGAEDAGRRALWDSEAFQPLISQIDDCLYFEETGHQICGEFQTYWGSYGLEMQDEGTSFRESLALFGYPLSEEFLDPSTGYVTQYFERAVFEHHPENPAPYDVLLRRLGAETIEQRNW